jgi:6-phosphogluconolactonase
VSPENIHAIPTDGTPEDAALRYEQTLQEAYGALTLDPRRTLSTSHCSGLVPTATPRRCYLGSRC